jgi:hypothetical protein
MVASEQNEPRSPGIVQVSHRVFQLKLCFNVLLKKSPKTFK